MGPEVPSRAQRALPALRRSEKDGGRMPPEFSCFLNSHMYKNVGMSTCLSPPPQKKLWTLQYCVKVTFGLGDHLSQVMSSLQPKAVIRS